MLDRLLEAKSGDFDFEHGDNMCDYDGSGCGYSVPFDPWNWFMSLFGLGGDDKGGDWDKSGWDEGDWEDK